MSLAGRRLYECCAGSARRELLRSRESIFPAAKAVELLMLIVALRALWLAPDWGRKVLALMRDFDAYREERRGRRKLRKAKPDQG